MHFDHFQDAETELVLVEEELNCVICGSIFKFNSAGEIFPGLVIIPETYFFAPSFEHATHPVGKFKDGRAPPFFG
jgi:hypothetical protein